MRSSLLRQARAGLAWGVFGFLLTTTGASAQTATPAPAAPPAAAAPKAPAPPAPPAEEAVGDESPTAEVPAEPVAPEAAPAIEFSPDPVLLQVGDTEKPEPGRKAKPKPTGPVLLALPTKEQRKPDPPPPLYKKGWFWGVVAGVVAAGVTAGLLLSREEAEGVAPCPEGVIGCFGAGEMP